MRLATIEAGGRVGPAVIRADEDASPLSAPSMQALIEGGAVALEAARAEIERAGAALRKGAYRLLAPIPRPRKNVFCVGRNYIEHIREGERAQGKTIGVTEHPVFFTKPPTAVVGPGEAGLLFPRLSTQLDYEVELAVIIGAAGRDIPRERAMAHVFGYTILNDLTARDVQRRHGGQFFKGKALDASCPMGPWIVTADEIADPSALGLRLWVNGEKRQDGRTADMIFDIPTLIASLSEGLTLEPGDVIATGTPSGVGYAMEPPRFLTDGDVATCEIDRIGRLETPIRAA
jgi:2-keto-4-pentenoate hydratase/2-oxohepta-3-ene-1,7-dioic acid hydratase in catechol pathway